MKPSILRASPLALASVAALASFGVPSDEKKVDYTFREPPVNSLGIKSLAELRGKPVLIDFWGVN
jgi:hypothetical protein